MPFITVLEPEMCESQTGKLILQETAQNDGPHVCQRHGEAISSEKEPNLCTDKAVIEVSPELLSCCKEGGDHVIKDICVDEGLPYKENILLENNETHKKVNLAHVDVDEDIDIAVKGLTAVASILYDFPVDSRGKQGKDQSLHFELPDNEAIYDDDLEKSLIGGWPGPIKYIACEKLMSNESRKEVIARQSHAFTIADNDVRQQKDNQVQTRDETTNACMMTAQDSDYCGTKEAVSFVSSTETQSGSIIMSTELLGPPTVPGGSGEKAISYKHDHHGHALAEHGDDASGHAASAGSSIGTLDGISDSEIRNSNTNPADLARNLCPALAVHGTEHGDSAGLGASSQGSILVHNGMNDSETRNSSANHEDISGNMYAGRNSTSGSIVCSGPVAYSGSISLRSDSSTTSTHSFAFPILPSDWNTSPVKMATADPRQLRKHGGWRMAFLCCRF